MNYVFSEKEPCESYCEHGGVCVLSFGHKDKHNSGYCRWTDENALPKDEADALYIQKGGVIAESMLKFESIIKGNLKVMRDAEGASPRNRESPLDAEREDFSTSHSH